MKKTLLVLSIILASVAVASAQPKEKGFTTQVYTTDAQVFIRDVVLYGWDVTTDGTNAVQFELYDTSDYETITGPLLRSYTITTSSTDRVQARDYPVPIQVTNGGVYLKVVTGNETGSIVLYYDYSKYRPYD